VSVVAEASSADPPVAPNRQVRLRPPWRGHLAVAAVALAVATYVTAGLWLDPARHVIAGNAGDQAFFEWLLGYGVYWLGHGADPFHTLLLNAPLGVNLASNTAITAYVLLFAPLTALAGPPVSFVTILTLNLAASAFAWYLFLSRYAVRHRAAAALGGFFCGFAPGFVSHANGHLNFTAGWIAPALLWWLFKLRDPGRPGRAGVVLGVLVAAAFTIAAEGLFFTALATAVFLGTWALARATRAEARAALPAVLRGLAVPAAVAGALLAYPLWMHFAGPQSFGRTGFNQRHYSEDLLAYVGYASRSLAGGAGLSAGRMAPNAAEQTSFFGVPLLVLTVVAVRALWRQATPGRRATLRALVVTGLAFVVLSFGPRLRIAKHDTPLVLPYALLRRLPLFDSALPGRYALVTAGVIGIVLALAADRLLREPLPAVRTHTAWAAAFAVALVPLAPLPLRWRERSPEPAFIADGTWRRYVPDGGVLTALPLAADTAADGQRWQAYTMARGGPQFRIPDGYFLGPGRDGKGRIGAPWRRTDRLFQLAAQHGYHRPTSDADRARARADFEYWGVRAVFLADEVTGADGPMDRSALESVATDLLGPPQRVQDVLLWRIQPGVDPVPAGGVARLAR
jgi:hypothetical protein